jgi:citrate synthase
LSAVDIAPNMCTVNLDQLNQYMNMSDWLTADEAMERLGVRAQTLYAYVSRGRIRAESDPDDPRRSRYRTSDVTQLEGRKARSRKQADVAQGAISWGEPVLASAITTVEGGRLYYRGRDAVTLAESETLESVARLLRGGHGAALKRQDRASPPNLPDMRARAFAVMAARAAEDPPSRGRAPLVLAVEAAGLLDALADAVAGMAQPGVIHERLARAWGCEGAGADLIRRVLVLLADHELNASTFAARVAASTGASLSAAALAGLAALSGPLHGGMAPRVEAFAADVGRLGARRAVAERLAQGSPIPGFGHQLYPDGDIRAEALMRVFEMPAAYRDLHAATVEATGEKANIDFVLTALAHRLALPEGAPFALFAVARCAGWIAHAMEQAGSGALIRPRARYVGPQPGL